jgi:hypothetical protein
LPDHHENRTARQVPDQQGLRQQVRDDAQTREPGEQDPAGHDQGQCRGERCGALRITAGQRGDDGTGHQGDRGLRARREHPRAAQNGVRDAGGQRGPQAYAITCGTRYAATATPAKTSARSHRRS